MKKQVYELYPFLQATAGNWRNAAFINCKSCPHHGALLCSGFLFTANADGSPVILSVEQFYQMTGEHPDQSECVATLSREAFESIYSLWLKWKIDDPTACAFLQLTS